MDEQRERGTNEKREMDEGRAGEIKRESRTKKDREG